MSPWAIYFAVLIGLILLCAGAMLFQVRPTRPCPMCESRTELSARRCRRCGYQFE